MEPVTALSPLPFDSKHLAMVAGLPCSATYFAAELCRDLLSRKHGTCEVIAVNDLGEATLEKIAAAEHPIVFLAEIPNAALVEAVREASFPVLVIDQAFSDASQEFIEARDAKLLDTIRTMARAQIGLNALVDIPRSALLEADLQQPARLLAERIARLCAIEAAQCLAMLKERDLDRPLIELLEAYFPDGRNSQPDETARLLHRLDRFYSFHPEKRDAAWSLPMDLLVEGVQPYLPATQAFPLLGPARCLSFGPYLYLSSGNWKGNFTFTTSDNQAVNTMGLDVTADEEIKFQESFDIVQSGKFTIEFHFNIKNSYYPFEFRTHLRRGSIGGTLTLISLLLEKCD